jgi:hypothetical protein
MRRECAVARPAGHTKKKVYHAAVEKRWQELGRPNGKKRLVGGTRLSASIREVLVGPGAQLAALVGDMTLVDRYDDACDALSRHDVGIVRTIVSVTR